jgi:hypothetical protein
MRRLPSLLLLPLALLGPAVAAGANDEAKGGASDRARVRAGPGGPRARVDDLV